MRTLSSSFFYLFHLLVSFHFLPDIYWMEEPYSVHVFYCIPHMFSNVYVTMRFFLHKCIVLYVYNTNQRSKYKKRITVYLWYHSSVTFTLGFCVFLFGDIVFFHFLFV